MKSKGRLGFGQVQGAVDTDQGLDRGVEFRVTLFAQPIAAGAVEGESDATPPRLDSSEHVTGLVPIAIEEENLKLAGIRGVGECRVECLAAGMEDPKFPCRVHDGVAIGVGAPLMQVEPGALDDALDESAGAGRAPQFALVDQDIDLDGGSEGGGTATEAPPWG